MTTKQQQDHPTQTQPTVTIFGRTMPKGDLVKFGGLIAFFAIMVAVCLLVWPYVAEIFEPGGVDRVIADVRNAGPIGFLILLGLQFLQVVVAFIPGEVVQLAAGMMYGPWLGALLILIGCVISSAFIYELVNRLGAPFVQSMVPVKYMDKFREFEKTGKLNSIVFILFLIPGMSKDVFTYIVPLTDMPLRTFLLLTTIGRIPGVVVSTYAADGLLDGRVMESVVLFVVLAVIAVVAILLKDKLIALLSGKK